ncbi:MAG: hypothetical protein HOL85_12980 [Rhodospirillaceae bacterium]|nr:hypothetical protein [Rhodospirillaceae bacterium]
MYFEVDTFEAKDLALLGRANISAAGRTFETRTVFYLPTRAEDWARIRGYAGGMAGGPEEISDYWDARASNFLYVFSRQQNMLAICGYFDSGYIGQFIDPTGQTFNLPARNNVQERVFKEFVDRDGPLIRSWYPLLPSLIDHYDLYKNLSVARLIEQQATAPGEGLRILEIGAGGCLLPLLLRRVAGVQRYDVIDLPFVLPMGFAMMRAFAPDVPIALPNEAVGDAWLRFQSSDDYSIEDGVYDAAVNVTSFGEMSQAQVEGYFGLLERALRPAGVFACINRTDKSTAFADYPWSKVGTEFVVDSEDPVSGYHHDRMQIMRRVVRRG